VVGFAVQEYGYPRFTVAVDIIVPDVELARDKLCMNGFRQNSRFKMNVMDRETKVEVDLLPAGGKLDPGFPYRHKYPANRKSSPYKVSFLPSCPRILAAALTGHKITPMLGRT